MGVTCEIKNRTMNLTLKKLRFIMTTINLAKLPVPSAIQPQTYEGILAALKSEFKKNMPSYTGLDNEGDAVNKVLQTMAVYALQQRTQINNGVRSVMLASATGGDLDNIGALFNLARKVITPADNTKTPPVAAVIESDEAFRVRIQLAPEGYSVAGSVGAYVFHSRNAHNNVKDVSVTSPTPGAITVTVLSNQGSGVPSNAVIDAVRAKLSDKDIRPLGDKVTVNKATVTGYEVEAELQISVTPDASVVKAAAEKRLSTYITEQHGIGKSVGLDGLYAALRVTGVDKVILKKPIADVTTNTSSAPYATKTTVSIKGD